MPEMDGYEVCRALRADPATSFLPVVMITASGEQEKLAAIEAGADDFIAKPFDQAELLARVRSLLRIKHYHDTIEAQAAELAAWNRELEQRVSDQVDALERMGRLQAVPVAAARRARRLVGRRLVPREPPPRDHRGLLRPARLHALRGDRRARGPDGGARRVPRRAGRPRPPLRRHARALHRRRAHGHLQRPARLPGRAGARRAHGAGDARPRRGARRGLEPSRTTTWTSASASPRGTRRSGASASRGAPTTRRSGASPTSRPGCARRRRGVRS